MRELDGKEVCGSNIEVSLAKPPSDKKKKEEILRNRERRMIQMMQGRGGMIGCVCHLFYGIPTLTSSIWIQMRWGLPHVAHTPNDGNGTPSRHVSSKNSYSTWTHGPRRLWWVDLSLVESRVIDFDYSTFEFLKLIDKLGHVLEIGFSRVIPRVFDEHVLFSSIRLWHTKVWHYRIDYTS